MLDKSNEPIEISTNSFQTIHNTINNHKNIEEQFKSNNEIQIINYSISDYDNLSDKTSSVQSIETLASNTSVISVMNSTNPSSEFVKLKETVKDQYQEKSVLEIEKSVAENINNNNNNNLNEMNQANKNWKNVRQKMRIVLTAMDYTRRRQQKLDNEASKRDSFMYRFSTQRRGNSLEKECMNTIKDDKQIKSKLTRNNKFNDTDHEFLKLWFKNSTQKEQKLNLSDHTSNDYESLLSGVKSTNQNDDNLHDNNSLINMNNNNSNKTLTNRASRILSENYSYNKYEGMGDMNFVEKAESDQNDFLVMKNNFYRRHIIFHPHSSGYLLWLTVISFAILYNLWAPIARQAFEELQTQYQALWFSLDATTDLIYLIDIFVQCNTSYLKRGLKVRSPRKLTTRYMTSYYFMIDTFSLFPLDLIQLKIGIYPMLRFPRLLKCYRCIEWKIRVENRSIFPNLWRVINLIHILFLGCHWFAAFYYLLSRYEEFKNPWGYQPNLNIEENTISRKYLKSFYWATLTLTTIGDLEAPTSSIELTFTIVSYLTGVFVFATIVGQVGNIITTRNADRIEFEKILDNAKSYMRSNSVNTELQNRILRWYDYAWSKGCGGGTQDINSIGLLPAKLKTELALNVNLETLKKVTIFQECRPEFLHDIVLKMKPLVFTPGDLICRKGEIAREMFIIADGVLEVLSETNEVLSTMSTGDFFGEIGVLNVDGVNKRTADVRAVGYTELFVLSREDILEALKDHPEAEIVMRKHARRRLHETRERRSAYLHGRKTHYAPDEIAKFPNSLQGSTKSGISMRTDEFEKNNDEKLFEQDNISEQIHLIDNSTIIDEDHNNNIDNDESKFTQSKSVESNTQCLHQDLPVSALKQFNDRWESILTSLVENYRRELFDLKLKNRLKI